MISLKGVANIKNLLKHKFIDLANKYQSKLTFEIKRKGDEYLCKDRDQLNI